MKLFSRTMSRSWPLGSALFLLLLTVGVSTAGATENGVSGASGKSNGFFCNGCHAGGTAPEVAFEGPAAVEPGAIATFRFIVTSTSASQVAAGFDVAASGGTVGVLPDQGTRLLIGDVTHSEPKTNDSQGKASFEFTWQAPTAPGTYTLFGAGCSVNANHLRTGDRAARTTLDVAVGVAVPTPTATIAPTPTATVRPSACVGDCGNDGAITVDELITGTNIALGQSQLAVCPVFDGNGDNQVTIDEILQAVNSALSGCPR